MLSQTRANMSTILGSHNVDVEDHILPIEKYHSLLQKMDT